MLLPTPERTSDRPLAQWLEGVLLTLRDRDEEDQRRTAAKETFKGEVSK